MTEDTKREQISLPKNLTDALRGAMADATFKAEHLKQFQEIAKQVESLETTCDYLRGQNDERDRKIKILECDNRELERQLEDYRNREKFLDDAEKAERETAINLATATARAVALSEVFETIFKNVTVRRNIVGGGTHSGENYSSSSIHREISEEME